MTNKEEWDAATPKQAVNVAEFDLLLQELRSLRDVKDDWVKKMETLNEQIDAIEAKILNFLKLTGKQNWEVPGIGMAYRINKKEVRFPQELAARREFAQYVLSKYGEDVRDSMFSVNYQALNSFYKNEAEPVPEKDKANFRIPGLDIPTTKEIIGFKRK